MTLTNKELLEFVQSAQQYEARRDADTKVKGEAPKLTKFDYALGKVLKKAIRKLELFNEKQSKVEIDNCEEDDKGVILRDERGNLKFKKESLLKRNSELQKIGDEEVELEPHIVKTIPPSVTIKEQLAFNGLIVNIEEPEEDQSAPTVATV